MKTKTNESKKVVEAIKERMGEEFLKDNPFITSDSFMQLVKVFATFPKIVMAACTNSGEATNVTLSLMVTFLKNIPDPLWDMMRQTAEKQNEGNPTKDLFKNMDSIRNFDGKNYMEWNPEHDEEDEPVFTTKPPTKPI